MLLPDKHIRLSESILGLGAFILERLDHPATVEWIHEEVLQCAGSRELPAHHDFDNALLALAFLFAVGALELTLDGRVVRCG